MARSKIISYPRSGFNWLWLRIHYFVKDIIGIETRNRDQTGRIVNKKVEAGYKYNRVQATHFGFNPLWSNLKLEDSNKTFEETNNEGDSFFILFREPKAVINSLFHYMIHYEQPKLFEHQQMTSSMSKFVYSEMGINRYIEYLNRLQIFCRDYKPISKPLSYIFYEENFNKSSVEHVVDIIGYNKSLNKDKLTNIFKETSMSSIQKWKTEDKPADRIVRNRTTNGVDGGRYRQGKLGDYVNYMSLEIQEYIDKTIKSRCKNMKYLERYY